MAPKESADSLLLHLAFKGVAGDTVTGLFARPKADGVYPCVLLLHGFPTATHMFRDIIPLLSDSFHVVAPDFHGFGQSDMPPRDRFSYSFANITDVTERFTDLIGLD